MNNKLRLFNHNKVSVSGIVSFPLLRHGYVLLIQDLLAGSLA